MDERERAAQIESAANGNPDALQRLIVHYHAPLRAALEGKMDPLVRPHIDPDDVLQEAYTAAFKTVTASRFDSPGQFYRWLETIALNRLKDQQRGLRRQKRDVAREIPRPGEARTSYPDLLHRLAAPDSTPSHHVARAEAVAAVISSLARLTDDQREVVRMRFLEGKPVAEVAACLGKSEPAIHMLCHRGLKALRTLMVSISRYLTQ